MENVVIFGCTFRQLTCRDCTQLITDQEWSTYVGGTRALLDSDAGYWSFRCGCQFKYPGVYFYPRLWRDFCEFWSYLGEQLYRDRYHGLRKNITKSVYFEIKGDRFYIYRARNHVR